MNLGKGEHNISVHSKWLGGKANASVPWGLIFQPVPRLAFFLFLKLFVYLAAPGLSCISRDL